MNGIRSRSIFSFFMLLALVNLAGCGSGESGTAKKKSSEVKVENLSPDRQQVKALTESENLLMNLSPRIKLISKSLSVNNPESLPYVSNDFKSIGLADVDFESLSQTDSHAAGKIPSASFYWPLDKEERSVGLHELFKPVYGLNEMEDLQIGTLEATLVAPDRLELKTKLESRIRKPDGQVVGLKGYQTLTWVNEGDWKLQKWIQEKLYVTVSSQTLFENVTELAIPDVATRQRLQSSSHQELILKLADSANKSGLEMQSPGEEYSSFGDWFSSYQYPSVSVLDLDQDGFDDLFVTDRWQASQLLRNKGDGTYEDVTESSGLVIDELANCVYFADFDNDGDSDAFVAISMGPSRFFINQDGKFTPDEYNNSIVKDSRFVVAASVVDINNDGLLDLYLSTYAYGRGAPQEWHKYATREADQLKMLIRIERQHHYIDRAGPPNIVLMNRDGRFEWAQIDDTLKQFHDSYQSSWTDIDDDGDLDAYVCNDFAGDAFLRNDTPQGSLRPVFVDATADIIGNAALNFAMGASWGDFDKDGDLDLYVSNMYSKAGMRICRQLDKVDERVAVSARGNFLYQNEAGKLTQIAGLDESDQQVATVGWSFGGQFADFDNDGELDLYVPSGFYSPPKELHTDKDL